MSVEQLAVSFPNLKNTSLTWLDISPNVAEYLSDFRRLTGCSLVLSTCYCRERSLSPDRQQLLDQLDLDLETWFCQEDISHIGQKFYQECMIWNTISDVHFKRMTYAAALQNATDITKLGKFLKLVEAEEQGSVMTVEVLEKLNSFADNLRSNFNTLRVREQLSWDSVPFLMNLYCREQP